MTDNTRVLTGVGRWSFPSLHEPHVYDDGGAKYGVTLLVTKDDTETMAPITAAVEAAVAQGEAKGLWTAKTKGVRLPIVDGDQAADEADEPTDDDPRRGHWVVRTSSTRRPSIAARDGSRIDDPDDVYGGCYGRLQVVAVPYSVGGNRGVTMVLLGAQKVRDGEPFGGSGPVTFDAWEGDDDDDFI